MPVDSDPFGPQFGCKSQLACHAPGDPSLLGKKFLHICSRKNFNHNSFYWSWMRV